MLIIIALLSVFSSSVVGYDRLTPDNSAILLVDFQTGLAAGVADQMMPIFKNNYQALVDVAVLYNLPVVLTTNLETGPNGPILPAVANAFPNATIIRRPGQINAWDDMDFVNAVNATGARKLIIAGIATDVGVALLALSAKDAGYDVSAVIDSSGTWSEMNRELAVFRMSDAGINIMNWFAVVSELQGDWRNATGPGLAQLLGTHIAFYGDLITIHDDLTANMTNTTNTGGA